jgi:hypothetical protein
MLWTCTGWTGAQKGANTSMNAYAILVVNEHLENLRLDAASRRSFRVERPSFPERVAALLSSLRSSIPTPATTAL